MNKILVLSQELFICRWKGTIQPIRRDKKTVVNYINSCIAQGLGKVDEFAVSSNMCSSYNVAEFIAIPVRIGTRFIFSKNRDARNGCRGRVIGIIKDGLYSVHIFTKKARPDCAEITIENMKDITNQ